MARGGLTAEPVVPPPPSLRRYLGFKRLPAGALRAIARAVERDATFRRRVADAVDEATAGRAGWLWLTRPDGWYDELTAIEAERAARVDEDEERRAEQAATKRLAAAQAATDRAEAEATRRAVECEDLRRQLAQAREQRRVAVDRLDEAEAEATRREAARVAAVRRLKDVEARLVERSTDLNAARARIRVLEAGGGQGDDRHPVGIEPAGRAAASSGTVAGPPSDAAAVSRAADAADTQAGAADAADSDTVSALVPDLLRQVRRAAGGAAELSQALAGVTAVLEGAGGSGPAASPGSETPRPVETTRPAAGAPAAQGGGRAPGGPTAGGPAGDDEAGDDEAGPAGPARRAPVRLPGGVFDDSAEAGEHLLRTPGAVLVVDGYNVTLAAWPGVSLADQRRRLVGALGELAARTSTPAEIVFDGADVDSGAVLAPARTLVRVRFSPPGIEADDVVIDLVAQLPASRPVVVASSDNRVRAGTRGLGANLLHATQLAQLLPRR